MENIYRRLKEHNDLIFRFKHSKLAEGVMFVSCIQKLNGWNLSESTNYSTTDFRGCPLFLRANVGLAPQATTYFGTSFPLSSWPAIVLFDAVSSKVLTASLNKVHQQNKKCFLDTNLLLMVAEISPASAHLKLTEIRVN